MSLSRTQRLVMVICISFGFFVGEISVGFLTHSLALVADAFHYLSDLISFIVALVALRISERPDSPQGFSFGWQRTQLLGAFFNGVFLVALGVSIFLQAIERFISLQRVENPRLVLIVGCVGLVLNIASAAFLHEHDHGPSGQHTDNGDGRSDVDLTSGVSITHLGHHHRNSSSLPKKGQDLGVLAVLIHVLSDAINNVGVIVAALIIWFGRSDGRYYADPAVSMFIAILILGSSFPIVKNSGRILLESAPLGLNLAEVQHDVELVPGVLAMHELHVWRLNQDKALASAHIVTSNGSLAAFMRQAQLIGECLHAYGIHSVTLQPEFVEQTVPAEATETSEHDQGLRLRSGRDPVCQIKCGDRCDDLTCCG